MRNREGKLVPEPARFTILVKQGNEGLIAHHHIIATATA